MKKYHLKLAAVLMLLILLAGCGSKTADISSYGDTPIEISGLTEEDFTITPNELAALECVSLTTSGTTAKSGTVSATGPLLETFLAQYDCTPSDFSKIQFLCADKYKTVLRDKYLTDYKTVLAVSNGSEPLPESMQPLRLLIPDAETGMWAYSVIRIEFEREDAAA